MSDNVTEITGAAEPETEVKAPTTYRVLKYDEDIVWHELAGDFVAKHGYKPDAEDIGRGFGAGEYLLIEQNPTYSHYWTYTMNVVADVRYREADEA